MPMIATDLSGRNTVAHYPIDSLNETCEKFFQIWSHKAANISNDLIEYTIRRMQSDRLRFLFQTRNELTQRENISPMCQLSIHTEDDLQRLKENIRRFCLTTRNVYRHLRSDSRIYPKMSINLDQGIMIKICRFIFKTKVLIQILSKEQHLSEQVKKYQTKEFDVYDPYRNITKAFIVLQSNFEILFGDILDRDFFQNAKTAVQTLPIILDTSKTIRLIFCALYKLSEPERQAEAEAIRQRRSGFCAHGYGGSRKHKVISSNLPMKNEDNKKLKTINEMLRLSQPQDTQTSLNTPIQTSSALPKTTSMNQSTVQAKTKTTKSSQKTPQPSKSQLNSPNTTASKTNKRQPTSPSTLKRKKESPNKSRTKERKKTKSSNVKTNNDKKAKNQNASTTYSPSSIQYNENSNSLNQINNTLNKSHFFDQTQISTQEKFGWTTWLHNATLSLATIFPLNQTNTKTTVSKPLLTTWASFDRISKT